MILNVWEGNSNMFSWSLYYTSVLLLIVTMFSPTWASVVIQVSAGKYDRSDTPVSLDLPPVLVRQDHFILTEVDTNNVVPVQVTGSDPARLVWLLSNPLAADKTRRYRLSGTSQSSTTGAGVEIDEDGKQLRVAARGKPVLVYNTGLILAQNRQESFYDRSGYIHPLYNPIGQTITDDFAPDHPHQHGIMFPWTKTLFEGRDVNFWDQKLGTGGIEHVAIESQMAGPVFGEFIACLTHFDRNLQDQPKAVLREFWRVRVYNLTDYFLFDLESVQYCVGEPLQVQEHHYGGLAIRGHRNWLTPGQGNFLTNEGKTRQDGNHTRPYWCDIHGNIDGQVTGVTVFCHPDNFRFPQPVRLHPSRPYFCFTPMAFGAFEIRADKPYVSRYRFYVHQGTLDHQRAEKHWHDLAAPPTVEIIDESAH